MREYYKYQVAMCTSKCWKAYNIKKWKNINKDCEKILKSISGDGISFNYKDGMHAWFCEYTWRGYTYGSAGFYWEDILDPVKFKKLRSDLVFFKWRARMDIRKNYKEELKKMEAKPNDQVD